MAKTDQEISTRTPKVALVGHGYWGKNLARNLHALGALGAIVESDPEVHPHLASLYPTVERHTDVEKVFKDPAIEGVVLATPAVTHAELGILALRAGKDVFVEKPLALTVEDGALMVSEAKRLGQVLMVGHLLEYHPAVLEMDRRVTEGDLGTIRYIYSNRLNWGRLRREENILWSFAPHDISVILRLVGSAPVRVMATGQGWINAGIHDVTVTHLEFEGNTSAHIYVSWLHPHKEQRLVVTGDRGVLVFEDSAAEPKRKLRRYAHSVEWVDRAPVAHKAPEELVDFSEDEPLLKECAAFLQAIRSRENPPTDGENALRVLRVLDAAQRSLSSGGNWIRLDEAQTGARQNFFVHDTALVDPGVSIKEDSKIWHFCHVSKGARIGRDCVLGQNCFVGNNVQIGDGVRIQNNVSVYAQVTLDDHVFVGPSAVFTNVRTPRSHINRKDEFSQTHVEHHATIGANSTIVCGTKIGHHALVGAGSVVTKDVAPNQVVYGNPARPKGWACSCGEVLPEANGTRLTCARCDRAYILEDSKLRQAENEDQH